MPPRKNTNAASQGDVDLEALFATQDSSGSDDAMMAVMAKQMQAAAEKKTRMRDAKLVQAYKAESEKLITTRAGQVQQLLTELFQELVILALEEAQNEDAIRKLWMEAGRGRVTFAASRLFDHRLCCAHKFAQEKMKAYYEVAGLHEETRVAENIPHLHAIRAAVNDVERVAESLHAMDG
ncbi:hypothetical protein PENSPDRAFT_749672 [Peniophora sp. CONT]|nr:hypothetical protein PENSPDRAFT_749672 [Peniophora sp. CONT]